MDDRRVLSGIFWILRSGAPWRDLPKVFGPHTTCYNRFSRWRKAGVWERLLKAVTLADGHAVQMIDTSVIRVHQHGACIAESDKQHIGRSRGGLTSKIHAVVDARGLPVTLGLTSGQAHDNRLVTSLLSNIKSGAVVLADRAYNADWIREFVHNRRAWANISPKRNRKRFIELKPVEYKSRNLIERFFNRLKQCRRIATRYDKLAANYMAFM